MLYRYFVLLCITLYHLYNFILLYIASYYFHIVLLCITLYYSAILRDTLCYFVRAFTRLFVSTAMMDDTPEKAHKGAEKGAGMGPQGGSRRGGVAAGEGRRWRPGESSRGPSGRAAGLSQPLERMRT